MVAYVRKARDLRRRFLDPELFGEPAWDILLDLYSANLAQKRVAVGSVCIASGVPATTAIRWLAAMEAKGLVRRRPDPSDRRRIFVELCPEITAAMDALFVALGAQLPDLHRSR
jgi:DNA-binding MarR family transcriptional regulator